MKSLFTRTTRNAPPPAPKSERDALAAGITLTEREREDLALLVRADRRHPEVLDDCDKRLALLKSQLATLDANANASDRLEHRRRTELPRLEKELADLYADAKAKAEAFRQSAGALAAKHAQITEEFGEVYHSGTTRVRGVSNYALFSLCGGVARLGESVALWLKQPEHR